MSFLLQNATDRHARHAIIPDPGLGEGLGHSFLPSLHYKQYCVLHLDNVCKRENFGLLCLYLLYVFLFFDPATPNLVLQSVAISKTTFGVSHMNG